MRKCLIFIGLAIWLIVVLILSVGVLSKDDIKSKNDPPSSFTESEFTDPSETETIPNESAAETTLPAAVAVQETDAAAIPTEPDSSHFSEEETFASEEATESEPTAEGNEASSFEACEISTNEINPFRYWLYTPSNPTDHMPLIVYLHGGSGKGEDLNLITSADGFPQYLQSGTLDNVRAYVLIPQLPSNQKGWDGIHDSLYSLIQLTVSEFSIDPGNISLTGHSMGGTGTWSFAAAYPDLFSRIAPLSGSMRNTSDTAAQLKDIPIWAFVGSADTIVPPESSEEVIALLQESGGNAKITVFDGADHFAVPSLTYLDEEINLAGWLTGQGSSDNIS